MRRDIRVAGLLIELFKVSLDGSDVRDDAIGGQIGEDLLKGRNCVFNGHCIDDQLRCKVLHLVQCGKALAIICEAQSSRVFLEDTHFMVEAEQIDEERSHLSCTHDKNLHFLSV